VEHFIQKSHAASLLSIKSVKFLTHFRKSPINKATQANRRNS
jgi:hypothetical protein